MRTNSSVCRRNGRNRRGAVILLIAFLLPVLFIIVGFSVDLANMQMARTELRAATDLAAKAAAETLARTGDTAQAVAQGQLIASKNQVAGIGLSLANSDFEFGRATRQLDGKWTFAPANSQQNSVRIVGSRTAGSPDGAINMFFGSLYGSSGFEPAVTTTAAFLNVDICLVLDRSSSMKKDLAETGGLSNSDPRWCQAPNGSARWIDLANAVDAFLDELLITPGAENIAVVTFGGPLGAGMPSCDNTVDYSVVSIDQDLTTNITLIEDAIDARSNSVWNGNTDIATGMQEGINVLLNAREGSDRVMILFTDGQYTEDNPVPMSLVAANNNIRVHTVTFGGDPSSSWIVDMQNIAQQYGR